MSQNYQTFNPNLGPSTMVDQIHGMVTPIHKHREHSRKSGWESSVGGNTSGCVGGWFQTNTMQLQVSI